MGPYGEIQVVDRGGWQKRYPLVKAITQIGSDPRSDIVLDASRGVGVEGRHVQIICWSVAGQGYRLVNIANTDVALSEDGGRILAPRSATEVGDGDTFRIGEFSLSMRLSGDRDTLGHQSQHTVQAEEQCIGMDVVLSMTQLAPNRTVEGAIVLRNLGDQNNVQFELDLEGLPSECYDIEPAPILFAGAEQRVLLRLHHTGKQPIAGTRTIEIHASAPRSYICNEVVVHRTIEVLPHYQYGLRWEEDRQAALDEPLGLPEPEHDSPRVFFVVRWWQRLQDLLVRKPAALPAPDPSAAETLPPVPKTEPAIEEKPETADAEVLFVTPEAVAEPDQDASDGSLGEPISPQEIEGAAVAPRESTEHSSVWVGPESQFGPPKIETPVVDLDAGEPEGTSVESPDGSAASDWAVSPDMAVSGEIVSVPDVPVIAVPEPEPSVVEDTHEALSPVYGEQVDSVLRDEPVVLTDEANAESLAHAETTSDDIPTDLAGEAPTATVEPSAIVEQTIDDEEWWEDEPQSETWWTSDRPAEPSRDETVQIRPVKVVKARVEPVEAMPEAGALPVLEPDDSGHDDGWWSSEDENEIEMEE